jgi:hypothetical protein
VAIQKVIRQVGVPPEKDAGIPRSVVTSADPAKPRTSAPGLGLGAKMSQPNGDPRKP